MVNKTYPRWLNITAFPCLFLPLIGLFVLISDGSTTLGLFLMFVGFLGIWIFGDIAAKVGKLKEKE